MINELANLSPEERGKIVAQNLTRLSSSASYYEDYFETWKICYKIYRAIKDDAESDDEPNLFIPLAYGIVEDAIARLVVPFLQKLSISVKPNNIFKTLFIKIKPFFRFI